MRGRQAIGVLLLLRTLFLRRCFYLGLRRAADWVAPKAPLPKIPPQTRTWHKAAALTRKWQLNQLAGRLEEMARKTAHPGERSLTCGRNLRAVQLIGLGL